MTMAKKVCLLWDNWFDVAIVTASTSEVDYPVELIQNRWRSSAWRSTDADSSGEWVKANLGSARAVKAFVLENMNLRENAVVHIHGNGSDAWGSPSVSHTITVTEEMETEGRIVYLLSSEESYQWWLFELTDAGNPDGYISVGRIYIGPVFEPRYSFRAPWSRVRESGSEIMMSIGGQTSATKRPKYWRYSLPIQIVGSSDIESFMAIDEACGVDTSLWICLDPNDEIVTSIYSRFTDHPEYTTVSKGYLWETVLNFREEL